MSKVKKWFENYWYHYKWHTIVGAFVAVFLAICIGQMVSKDKVDVYILYAGPKSFTASEISEIEKAFVDVVDDNNGDGKKIVRFTNMLYLTDKRIEELKQEAEANGGKYKPDAAFISEERESYKLRLMAGDAFILLLDPEVYSGDYDTGMFTKLADMGIESEAAYDDSSVVFRKTDFGGFVSAFECIPEDTLMCFKVMTVTEKAQGKKVEKAHNNQYEFFKKLIEFTVEQ